METTADDNSRIGLLLGYQIKYTKDFILFSAAPKKLILTDQLKRSVRKFCSCWKMKVGEIPVGTISSRQECGL